MEQNTGFEVKFDSEETKDPIENFNANLKIIEDNIIGIESRLWRLFA